MCKFVTLEGNLDVTPFAKGSIDVKVFYAQG